MAEKTHTSDYGRQLMEKQRLRHQYNMSEKQLRGVFEKAVRKPGNTGEVMLQMLESRLDAVVLRAGMARSIYQARQMVCPHSFVLKASHGTLHDRAEMRDRSLSLGYCNCRMASKTL